MYASESWTLSLIKLLVEYNKILLKDFTPLYRKKKRGELFAIYLSKQKERIVFHDRIYLK